MNFDNKPVGRSPGAFVLEASQVKARIPGKGVETPKLTLHEIIPKLGQYRQTGELCCTLRQKHLLLTRILVKNFLGFSKNTRQLPHSQLDFWLIFRARPTLGN
jgi:hypothetical protein